MSFLERSFLIRKIYCVRACVRARVRACVRACVCTYVYACMHVCVHTWTASDMWYGVSFTISC